MINKVNLAKYQERKKWYKKKPMLIASKNLKKANSNHPINNHLKGNFAKQQF